MAAAASLVKPTGALAAVPLFLHLIIRRRTRDAIRFGVLVSLFGMAAWSAVFWQSEGFYYWGAIKANLPQFSLWRGYVQTYGFLASPIAVGALLSLAFAAVGHPAALLESPYRLGFVVSTSFAAVMDCREGSTFNYFIRATGRGDVAIGNPGCDQLALC